MNPRAGVPTGVLTLAGEELLRQREAEQRCVDLLVGEGFQLIHLPVLEYANGEPGAGYRFVDRAGHLIAVRSDFTPLAARALTPVLAAGPLPLSVCYAGEVVRPQPARLRQLPELYQLGFERYGAGGGGEAALALTLRLLHIAGVAAARCHVTVSLAGLARQLLAHVVEEPPDDELLELLRVRDLDGLAAKVPLGASARAALEAALLGEEEGRWGEYFGVEEELAQLGDLLALARGGGATASVDVAPRLAGEYYRGVVFSVWGRATRVVVASGGEYEVELPGRTLPAVGGGVALGIALEEASS